MEEEKSPDMPLTVFGVARIIDGLFIGDLSVALNARFIQQHNITHVVNCAGHKIENEFQKHGVRYFTLYWSVDDRQLLFDPGDQIAKEAIKFIDEALEYGSQVLVHSQNG